MSIKHTVHRLQSITDDQLKWICELNKRVYASDPGTEILLGGNTGLSNDYWSALLRATLLEGELWVVTVGKGEDEKIASWASWFAPGTGLFRTEAQRALGYNEFFKKCKPEMQEWLSKIFPSYVSKLLNNIFTPEERKNNWWCSGIATHESYQRRGFASALLDIGYQKSRRSGESGTFVALGTTNPVNIPVYNSVGFTVAGDVEIPSPIGNLHSYIMTRRG